MSDAQVQFHQNPENPHTSAPDGHSLSFNELKSIYQTLANKNIPDEGKTQAAQAAEAHRDETLPLLRLNMLVAAISFTVCAGTFGLEVTGDINELLIPTGLRISSDFEIITYPVLLSIGIYSFFTLINSAKAYNFMKEYYNDHTPQTNQRRVTRSEGQNR